MTEAFRSAWEDLRAMMTETVLLIALEVIRLVESLIGSANTQKLLALPEVQRANALADIMEELKFGKAG